MPITIPEEYRIPSEVRKHYFLDEYVVIAPKRAVRPKAVGDKVVSIKTDVEPAIEKEPSLFEITDDQGNWIVKVVANSYPAFSIDSQTAYGQQEIVLETREQNTRFCSLSVQQLEKVFEAFVARIAAINRDPKIKHVSVFKNHGREAGASLAHIHSQIIATDFAPPALQTEAEAFERYLAEHGRSPIEDAIMRELKDDRRIIFNDPSVVTFAPYASQFPFEAWIVPKRAVHSMHDLSSDERRDMARHLKMLATALDSHDFSFNYYLHEGVRDHKHHFMIKLTPRPNIWAGFELSTGVIINPAPPEYAAIWYQEMSKLHAC